MSSIINGVASEYDMQKVSRTYESNSKLPQTSCRVPMPKTKEFGEKICENCDKEDVCMYKEECMKAVKDILDIVSRANVFIRTHIDCKKWSKKSVGINMNDILYRQKG